MTLEPWMVYLVGQCDEIRKGISFIGVLVGCFGMGSLAFCVLKERINRWSVGLVIFAFVLLFAASLIPSTKTAAAMFVLPPIVNSGAAQSLPEELIDLAREWIRELKPVKGDPL